jgi:hypothetical protein
LIVRDANGELLEPQPTAPIPVDPESVVAEVKRLRRQFGPKITIESDQILAARQHMRECEQRLSA